MSGRYLLSAMTARYRLGASIVAAVLLAGCGGLQPEDPGAVLTGKFGDNGTDSTVEVDLSGFNGPVNIASPARTS